ncbi:DUF4209 domain-containing protein [Flammeovirga sp. SJP92]|uniref:DUF4209 domain-containing protein n=1 Tax=Flammeovirga sp. SJP92 TaxID=1775430 RepID=UPI0007868953|nr:DUF4209 domain-containing protein [Flammeovirga sp. SJP92]KXX70957.1 hypothetical protein AVL50_10130 [Flammeovirga sp. SJP92]
MKEIIERIELYEKKSEHDIATEFREFLPKEGEDIPLELKAEIMAFNFVENYPNKDTGWDTYFGPMVVYPNGDEYPSIKHLTPEILDYWSKRIKETKNPLIQARYNGLIWDFSKLILGKKPDYNIGLQYITNLLDTVERRICNHNIELKTKIKRALQLSISLNSEELIERAKHVTLNLEDEIGVNDKAGLWGFSFDMLIEEKKISLTGDEENRIINTLEKRFNELTSENELNPWNAEASAKRLATYYRKKGENDKVKELILRLGKSYEAYEKNGNAMQISSWLQHIHKIYLNYGLNEEANEVLVRLRELGPKVNEELKPVSSSFEIPKDELEDFVNFFIEDDKNLIFHKILQNFLPKKDEVKERVFELAKVSPLTFLIPTNIQDYKGRVVATIGSIEDDIDGNIIHQLSQNLSFQSIFLRNVFSRIISDKILNTNDFISFLENSVVFEESRLTIIKRGIQAYFEDDLIVAVHILIPQIEEAIRNLVELLGGVVLKKSRGGGFQLKTFDDILRNEIIKEILGEDTQLYLRVLFTDQRGWNLRNNVCHGMSEIGTFSYQSVERILHVLIILGTIVRKEETTNR